MMKSYQQINWKKCQNDLNKMQEDLVWSFRAGNKKKVKALQNQIVNSFATRALAVRRVTTNKGSLTAGVDGVTWKTSQARMDAIQQLRYWTENPKLYKAKPVRRVMIPKPKQPLEKRPLGIPAMIDRAMQEVYRMSLDPIVEETSDPNSYGFRKYRGCRDAMAKLAGSLDRSFCAQWVLDADIEKCFDRINHEWLVDKVPIVHRQVLISWLKSGVKPFGQVEYSDNGTPQGGTISPLLCNVCLNGLEPVVEAAAQDSGLRSPKVHVVRYADDFVITGANEAVLNKIEKAVDDFLKPRGLRMHPGKTRKVNIAKQSVEFLGYELMKKPIDLRKNLPSPKGNTVDRLICWPSKSSQQQLKLKVNRALQTQAPIKGIIKQLNPIIIGWANYFRYTRSSMRVFSPLPHKGKGRGGWVISYGMPWSGGVRRNTKIGEPGGLLILTQEKLKRELSNGAILKGKMLYG